MATLVPLPIYPSSHARKGFSASQLAQFHLNICNALAQVIALPPAKRDTPATRAFVSSYASDAAHQVLEALIWEHADAAKGDDRLPQRVLLLAEKLASSAPGLELRTLLDLCVAFSSKASRLKAIFTAALGGTPDLTSRFASEVVPAFTALLNSSQSSGLYRLRKTARCVTSLLRPSPPELIRPFAHSKNFILALARAYEDGLNAISRSYGGIRTDVPNRQLDDWEQPWLATKVDLVDAFHIIMTTMVKDVSTASGTQLAAEADRACGIVFALLAVTPQLGQMQFANPGSAIPFLNRSLVADYQHAYDLNRMLASTLRHAAREDALVEALKSTLRSLDLESSRGNSAKDPGVLKLLLRSSGIAPGSSNKLRSATQSASTDKGKAKATAPRPTPTHDPDLDLKISQVFDIFPEKSPEYIRGLLLHPPLRGNTEKVIEVLLDGTAPGKDALGDGFEGNFSVGGGDGHPPAIDAPFVRLNVFDGEIIDLDRLHIGKKMYDHKKSTFIPSHDTLISFGQTRRNDVGQR
jgi:activating signal cointegrator complex subunit 2